MRSSRFDTKQTGRNAMVDSLLGAGAREKRKQDNKQKYRPDKSVKPEDLLTPEDFDTAVSYEDKQMAGVASLAYVDGNGRRDENYNGEIQIGGLTHKIKNGQLRIISDDVLEDTLEPIIQQERYNQAIVSSMLYGGDKIALYLLGAKAFGQLPDWARPNKLQTLHERSEAFSKGVHELTQAVRNASIIVDDERIMRFLDQGLYGKGGMPSRGGSKEE